MAKKTTKTQNLRLKSFKSRCLLMPMINKPVQLRLFPTEDDAILYSRSSAYQGLDDTGQRVVRAYIMALSDSGVFPSQSKIASMAGLSRHAVANALGNRASQSWQAITEILASCREDLAVRGSIAIPQIAWLILSQFVPGEGKLVRSTSTLTKVELEVLKAAAAMGGVTGLEGSQTVTVAATTTGDKAGVSVQVSGPSDSASGLAELVSRLRQSQLGHANASPMHVSGHFAEAAETVPVEAGADDGGQTPGVLEEADGGQA